MIKLTKCNDLRALDTKHANTNGALAYVATDDAGMLGHSVYTADGDAVTLLEVKTKDNDWPLADGLARAALFSCLDTCEYAVFAEGDALTERFARALRVKPGERVKLEEVFKPCCGCEAHGEN